MLNTHRQPLCCNKNLKRLSAKTVSCLCCGNGNKHWFPFIHVYILTLQPSLLRLTFSNNIISFTFFQSKIQIDSCHSRIYNASLSSIKSLFESYASYIFSFALAVEHQSWENIFGIGRC